jgi:hypothetical protein
LNILEIVNHPDPDEGLYELQNQLHVGGPDSSEILEALSYYKLFHPEVFRKSEQQILSSLGLFYKVQDPNNIYSVLLAGFGEQHKEQYGRYLTPVQASVRRAVDGYQIVSISAPTSAGKSYSIRGFIVSGQGDAVVIVPSRALIAEYLTAMRESFNNDKSVMISPFVDVVFTNRTLRRIFVLTPERARDLLNDNLDLDIKLFFFDEAQISDEGFRGVIFDVLVRRVKKQFPAAKLVFAHPNVENPDAQFSKHGLLNAGGYSRSYDYGAVGKVSVFSHSNGKDYYFSPNKGDGHKVINCFEFKGSFEEYAFSHGHSVLIYVSKQSVYNGNFLIEYENYIRDFPEISDNSALDIITTIRELIGADQNVFHSDLISLMLKGVVIHHGSVPLEIRFLIEDFIRAGHARVCFATSTLAQGINMPFDIVWLENMRFQGDEARKSLDFKNLIGRSGRLSLNPKFDYGYVYTKNPKLFIKRSMDKYTLKESSIIDEPIDDSLFDSRELIEAIRNDTFDDDKHLPIAQVDRLSDPRLLDSSRLILDIVFGGAGIIKGNLSGADNRENREMVLTCLLKIYETSLGRVMSLGEKAVFNSAVGIFFHVILGRSFKEIVGIRYSRISKRDTKSIGDAKFSQPASKLPQSNLQRYSLYPLNTPASEVSFDRIVFDTYDYLDQVISYSLADVFVAAFNIYLDKTRDGRATKFIELLTYGTNDPSYILLMRYGFSSENILEILPYIDSVTEEEINFSGEIERAPIYIKNIVNWYLP